MLYSSWSMLTVSSLIFSIHTIDLRNGKIFKHQSIFITKIQHQSPLSSIPLVARKQEIGKFRCHKKRIGWFRKQKKLPELNILNLNDLSKKSHAQDLEIFDNKCTIKFHRMWLFISKNLSEQGKSQSWTLCSKLTLMHTWLLCQDIYGLHTRL